MVVTDKAKKKKSVMIVDAHQLVRAGFAHILREHLNISTIVEIESGEKAIKEVRVKRPDIIIIEFNLPGITGAEASRKLLAYDHSLKIILLINPKVYSATRQFVSCGIKGFLTKNNSVKELLEAVAKVESGNCYMAPSIATKMAFAVINEESESPFEILSPRELEIVMMILDGKKNQEMAAILYISDKTVSTYRARALNKLEVKSTTELTLLAMRYGLIDPG